jgi:DASS family divalent anion:Na+ symporter
MDNGWCFFWVLSPVLNINLAIVAFIGLSILILAKVYTTEDIREGGGDVLETYIWFAILYLISSELNNLRFMKILGAQLATYVDNFHWISEYTLLTVLYILIHYLFVSQTAHLLALYAVFLKVSVNAEVPVALMAFMLSFATNLFAAISP